ncbi:MAG: HAD family hydrolase [Thermodesulfobacteriota bacterium]
MIQVTIPGHGDIQLHHLVLDYNGTLAVDGRLVPGVKQILMELSQVVEIHVVTADTFGQAAANLEGLPCRLTILPEGRQDEGKRDFVRSLGAHRTCSMGNGRNDCLMLAESALGVAVILEEGASARAVTAANVVCTDIVAALRLLQNPLRLKATLRF